MATTYKARHAARKVKGRARVFAGKAAGERGHELNIRVNHADGDFKPTPEMAAEPVAE